MFVVYPFSMLRNLSSLRYFCLISVMCYGLIVFSMIKEAFDPTLCDISKNLAQATLIDVN